MKRHLTTILLVLAAVGLSVYLYRDRDRVTESERRSRENSVFPVWRRDDLTRIEVAHEGESIVIERENKDKAWRMSSPREEHVDQAAAERLITTLEFANVVRKVGEGDRLGLDQPRASGSVRMGAMTFRFSLGGVSPRPEGSSYFKVDDGVPFVVSKELTETLLASSDTYRDRSVVPYLSLELSKFTLTHGPGGSQGIALERLDTRSFEVTVDGGSLLASRKHLDRVWGALAEMRAESFPKDADADRLTAEPQMTIRMEPKEAGKGAAVLVVGAACPGHPDDVVVLRKEPTRAAACAPKGAIDRLRELTPASLVDDVPFGFRHDEIEELRLEGGEVKPIEVARRGIGFHLREPADRELTTEEADAVGELLVSIERDTARSVRRFEPGSAFRAVGKAKVRVDEFEEVVEVGAPDPDSGEVPVHRLRDDALLVMSQVAARRLLPRETTLRSRALLPKESRRVTRVALRCGVDQDFADTGEGLRMTSPADFETDGGITALVDAVMRGKVHEWTADRDDGSFGIVRDGPGSCRLVLAFEHEKSPVTMHIGFVPQRLEVFGSIDGERGVFVPDAVLPSLMKKLYVSRSAIRVDPSAVRDLTVKERGNVVKGNLAKRLKLSSVFDDPPATKLGTNDVGPVDVELIYGLEPGDGGSNPAESSRRIVCSVAKERWRECANPSVKAVFQVSAKGVDDVVRGAADPAISDAGTSDAR